MVMRGLSWLLSSRIVSASSERVGCAVRIWRTRFVHYTRLDWSKSLRGGSFENSRSVFQIVWA
jgi:hypothetical protein